MTTYSAEAQQLRIEVQGWISELNHKLISDLGSTMGKVNELENDLKLLDSVRTLRWLNIARFGSNRFGIVLPVQKFGSGSVVENT